MPARPGLMWLSLKSKRTNTQNWKGHFSWPPAVRRPRLQHPTRTWWHWDRSGTHSGFPMVHHPDRATLFWRQRIAFTQQATSKAHFPMRSRREQGHDFRARDGFGKTQECLGTLASISEWGSNLTQNPSTLGLWYLWELDEHLNVLPKKKMQLC